MLYVDMVRVTLPLALNYCFSSPNDLLAQSTALGHIYLPMNKTIQEHYVGPVVRYDTIVSI